MIEFEGAPTIGVPVLPHFLASLNGRTTVLPAEEGWGTLEVALVQYTCSNA